MTKDFVSSLLHARRRGVQILVVVGAAGLASWSATKAGVTPGDTFDVEAVGYNQADPADDNTYLIYPIADANFGSQESFPDAGVNGQTVTVISTESTSAGITTDTFIVSVPTNFVPAGTFADGRPIDAADFAIGDFYGGTDTVDFSTPVFAPVTTGSVTFVPIGTSTVTAAGESQSPMFTNGGLSFSDAENPTSYTANYPLTNYNITSFSISVSYTSVPEPSTVALTLLGGSGLVWLALRRRQVGA